MANQSDGEDIQDVLVQILGHLSHLPDMLGHLSSIMERMVSGMLPMIEAIRRFSDLSSSGSGGSGSGSGGKPPGGFGAGAGMGGRLGAAAGVAAAALGALVVVVKVLEQQFQMMVSYVRAFNPGVVDMFNQSLANLQATLGRAFVPVIQAATQVVREWTSILAPTMQALVPIMQRVGEVFGNMLLRVLAKVGAVFQAFLPTIERGTDIFKVVGEIVIYVVDGLGKLFRILALVVRVFWELSGIGTIVRIVGAAFEALNKVMEVASEALSIIEVTVNTLIDQFLEFIKALLPFDGLMDQLDNAIQFVIRNMYVFAVMLAKFAGMDRVVDALIEHVEGKLKAGDTAAQTPQIKNLDQLSKDLALAAAAAGGAAGGKDGIKNQEEFWKRTLEEMKEARKGNVTVQSILIEIKLAILRAMQSLMPGGGAPLAPSPQGGSAAPGGITSPWGKNVSSDVSDIVRRAIAGGL